MGGGDATTTRRGMNGTILGRRSAVDDQPKTRKPPDFQGVLYIAGAGFEHISPTLAYRFVEVVRLRP
jgi:hypothetical protein